MSACGRSNFGPRGAGAASAFRCGGCWCASPWLLSRAMARASDTSTVLNAHPGTEQDTMTMVRQDFVLHKVKLVVGIWCLFNNEERNLKYN